MSIERTGRRPGPRPVRICPKCRDKMSERPLADSGIRIDACPTCHGLWFDHWELEGHLGGPDAEIVPSADAHMTDRHCPACRIPMTSFTASGTDVTVDMCETCKGIWLDSGELKQLEQSQKKPEGWLAIILRLLGLG